MRTDWMIQFMRSSRASKTNYRASNENSGGWGAGGVGRSGLTEKEQQGTLWWWTCSTSLLACEWHRCGHLSKCMDRDALQSSTPRKEGRPTSISWKREETRCSIHCKLLTRLSMQLTNIKRQPIFQAVLKSRDIFLHACTAYVFSNVYRVFIKVVLWGSCN